VSDLRIKPKCTRLEEVSEINEDVESKEWWSPKELQQWLGCGRSMIYKLLAEGKIPSHSVGRLIRVRRRDVEAFLADNRYRPEDRC
jgi:excisionase family DNA binding protein